MKNLLIGLMALSLCASALAQKKTLNLSLVPDFALESSDERIIGLTLSVWGENPQEALALGLVNGSKADSSGINFGLFNYGDDFDGIQWGALNSVSGDMNGWQHGLGNHAGGQLWGLQTGVINFTGTLRGLQLGLINHAHKGEAGGQIGLLNFIADNAWFSELPSEVAPAMLFVNWRF
jgi:hypothetical protein